MSCAAATILVENRSWADAVFNRMKLTPTLVANFQSLSRLLFAVFEFIWEIFAGSRVPDGDDTCHSGGVQRTRGGPKIKRQHSQQIDVWRTTQKRVIASCMDSEESLEDERWENGAFTECLLKALKDQSTAGKDGEINIEELYGSTRSMTAELTDNRQTPTSSGRTLNHGITNLAIVGESE